MATAGTVTPQVAPPPEAHRIAVGDRFLVDGATGTVVALTDDDGEPAQALDGPAVREVWVKIDPHDVATLGRRYTVVLTPTGTCRLDEHRWQ